MLNLYQVSDTYCRSPLEDACLLLMAALASHDGQQREYFQQVDADFLTHFAATISNKQELRLLKETVGLCVDLLFTDEFDYAEKPYLCHLMVLAQAKKARTKNAVKGKIVTGSPLLALFVEIHNLFNTHYWGRYYKQDQKKALFSAFSELKIHTVSRESSQRGVMIFFEGKRDICSQACIDTLTMVPAFLDKALPLHRRAGLTLGAAAAFWQENHAERVMDYNTIKRVLGPYLQSLSDLYHAILPSKNKIQQTEYEMIAYAKVALQQGPFDAREKESFFRTLDNFVQTHPAISISAVEDNRASISLAKLNLEELVNAQRVSISISDNPIAHIKSISAPSLVNLVIEDIGRLFSSLDSWARQRYPDAVETAVPTTEICKLSPPLEQIRQSLIAAVEQVAVDQCESASRDCALALLAWKDEIVTQASYQRSDTPDHLAPPPRPLVPAPVRFSRPYSEISLLSDWSVSDVEFPDFDMLSDSDDEASTHSNVSEKPKSTGSVTGSSTLWHNKSNTPCLVADAAVQVTKLTTDEDALTKSPHC